MEKGIRVSTNMLSSLPTPTNPTDLSQYKLSSPPPKSSPDGRSDSVSPASSPPASSFPPPPLSVSMAGGGFGGPPGAGGISMVSMASILNRPPSFGFPGAAAAAAALGFPSPGGFSPKDFSRLSGGPGGPGDYGGVSPLSMIQNRPYTRSPPPMVAPNDPTANDCKIVDYRGEKIAAFMINNKTMLCLPQAFELFLKNLVGGLHTVYTKCKRLEIVPMICNVEQVRVLRGLGAIQPGVNRCKLIADTDFDTLYKDCTTSRSGRPPKRVMPFPAMSPQDAMLRLQQSSGGSSGPHGGGMGPNGGLSQPPSMSSAADHFPPFGLGKDVMTGGFPGMVGSKDGGPPSGLADRFGGLTGGLPPHPAAMGHLMSLNNPAAQAALLRGSGVLPGGLPGGLPGLPTLQLPGSSPQALLESYKQSYGDMLKHLQGLQKGPDRRGSPDIKDYMADTDNSVLNLSRTQSDNQDDISVRSESDIGEAEPRHQLSDEDMDHDNDNASKTDHENEDREGGDTDRDRDGGETDDRDNDSSSENGGKTEENGGVVGAGKMGNMFQMMNHIQSLISMAVENAKEGGPKDPTTAIKRKIDEESKTTDFYLKQFKKEKRLRKRLEEQLEMETRKIVKLETALRNLDYDTLIKVKESIARDAAQRETEKLQKSANKSNENGANEISADHENAALNNSSASLQSATGGDISSADESSPTPTTGGEGGYQHSINYSVAARAVERSSGAGSTSGGSVSVATGLFPTVSLATTMAHTSY